MVNRQNAKSAAAILLAFCLLVTPVLSQTRRPATPAGLPGIAFQSNGAGAAPAQDVKEEPRGIDELLEPREYTVYLEARDIGSQIKSGGVSSVLQPLLPLMGNAPSELTKFSRFLVANADSLEKSRIVMAFEPVKQTLPSVLLAVELSSADDAIAFEPKFKDLVLSLFFPAVTPTLDDTEDNSSGKDKANAAGAPNSPNAMMPSPFFFKRVGNLVMVADRQFLLKDLRAADAKTMMDDSSFRGAHERFANDSLFLYVDVALTEQMHQEQRKKSEEMDRLINAKSDEAIAKEEEASKQNPPPPEIKSQTPPPPAPPSPANPQTVEKVSGQESQRRRSEIGTEQKAGSVAGSSTKAKPTPTAEQQQAEYQRLMGTVFQLLLSGGTTKDPDAVAVGLSISSNNIALRVLLVEQPNVEKTLLPFVPLLAAGPPMAPEAVYFMPTDTDLFFSASFDLPRVYDKLMEALGAINTANNAQAPARGKTQQPAEPSAEEILNAFEKAQGFKVRDDLIATLGNEIAVSVPVPDDIVPTMSPSMINQILAPGSIYLISINDKAAFQKLLPKVVSALDLAVPAGKTPNEKSHGVELIKFKHGFYALTDRFLVIGPDAKSLKHMLDAKANNDTLIDSGAYNQATLWAPKKMIGQLYLSSKIMSNMQKTFRAVSANAADDIKDFMAKFEVEPRPTTYTVSADPMGTVHELHLPTSLVSLFTAGTVASYSMGVMAQSEFSAMNVLTTIHSLKSGQKGGSAAALNFNSIEELTKLAKSSSEQMMKLEESGAQDESKIAGLNRLAQLNSKLTAIKGIYDLDLRVSGSGFEATATPKAYGKTARKSYYIDQSGTVRGGDLGGKPASSSDQPIANDTGLMRIPGLDQ